MRRIVILPMILISAVLTGCTMTPLSQPTAPTVLFVLQATSATVEADHDTGVLTLILPTNGLHLVWFTDRPTRAAGTKRPAWLVREWKALGFADCPPNAAISFMHHAVTSSSEPLLAVASLTNPRLNEQLNTMEFTIDMIAESVLPDRMPDVALFIDSAQGDPIRGDLPIEPSRTGWFDTAPKE